MSSKVCPICKKLTVHTFRPFCSKRCKDIDLNRWISGVYSIPGDSLQEDLSKEEGDSST